MADRRTPDPTTLADWTRASDASGSYNVLQEYSAARAALHHPPEFRFEVVHLAD